MHKEKAWISAHLYYGEPFESLLSRAIRPFIEKVFQNKLAEQFFFIRYWERGPHIRLRLEGEKNIMNQKIKPQLESFFLSYFRKNPSRRKKPKWIHNRHQQDRWFPNNSIQYTEYEPEIERYGGPSGIRIAEKQFDISSRTILSIIHESKNWSYERALGAAIQLHLGFTFSLGMNLYETFQFYSHFFKIWLSRSLGLKSNIPEVELKKRKNSTLEAFEKKFTQQMSILVPFHRDLWNAFVNKTEFKQKWLNKWLHEMCGIASELKRAQSKKQLIFSKRNKPNPDINVPEANPQLWSILGSYVHMTNNRLGILNRDEAFLGYLIKRGLEYL